MSREEVLAGRAVSASAGMLLYSYHEGLLVVLAGVRKTVPWRDYSSIVFGSLVKPTDKDALGAALREAHEETGGGLTIEVPGLSFVAALGPESYHHLLKLEGNFLHAIETNIPIDPQLKFVCNVFAGYVSHGTPRETAEMSDFEWVEPLELARSQARLAFDQALVLQHFYEMWFFSGNLFRKPRSENPIFISPV